MTFVISSQGQRDNSSDWKRLVAGGLSLTACIVPASLESDGLLDLEQYI